MKYILSIFFYYLIGNKIPSKFGGNKIRRMLVKNIFKECGENVTISDHVYFGNGKNITLKSNSGIGKYSKIMGAADVIIEEDVMTGAEVLIITGMHEMSWTMKDGNLIRENKSREKEIIIEQGAVIASRAIILGGVTIKKGSIIGAASLVNKDTEEYYFYAGVPIKKIKSKINLN